MKKPTQSGANQASTKLQRELAEVVAALADSGALSAQSLPRVLDLIERFCTFCEPGYGFDSLGQVSPDVSAAFVQAPTVAGLPAHATMNFRRSIVRLIFRAARELEFTDGDPTLDLVLPPRSSVQSRPLAADEVAVSRSASLRTLTSTRPSAAWALAEASGGRPSSAIFR